MLVNLKDIFEKHSESAPVNIEAIIRDVGLELDKKADLGNDVAGQIEKIGDSQYKISVNKNDHYYRQRFTMAHELGHFLLHRDLIGDGVNDNKMYRISAEHELYNTKIGNAQETEANRFAASVLMPRDLISALEEDGLSKAEIAKRLQVSDQALAIRLAK